MNRHILNGRRLAAITTLALLAACGSFVTPAPTKSGGGLGGTGGPVPLSCAQNANVGLGIPMGSAASFAVLAGSTVTNAGPSIITGDLAVSPGVTYVSGRRDRIGAVFTGPGPNAASAAQLDNTVA